MEKAKKRWVKPLVITLLSIFGVLAILVIIILAGSTSAIKYARTFDAVENAQLAMSTDAEGNTVFEKADGEDFKILQLTDIHIGAGILSRKKDKMALDACYRLIEESKPDLIIATGDIAFPIPYPSGTNNNMLAARAFGTFMDAVGIPWTLTFGNHDTESFATHSKKKIAAYYESCESSIFLPGPEELTGMGNQIIKIKNSDQSLNQVLYLFDSNMYVDFAWNWNYDKIHQDQIDWYETQVKAIEAAEGRNVPSLAFFHIPLKEYGTAWSLYKQGSAEVQYHSGTVGEEDEMIWSPQDGDLFEALVRLGSTKGTFCGHDHLNNFSITYQGVRLSYGYSIDYLAYCKEDMTEQRGGTLITVDALGAFDVSYLNLAKL